MLVAKERMCCEHPLQSGALKTPHFGWRIRWFSGRKFIMKFPGVPYRFGENHANLAGLLRVDGAGLWPKSAATQNPLNGTKRGSNRSPLTNKESG
ncbi:MAG: hypothetical protein ACXVZH_00175 [Terriglobales bacterium]